jgi:hypothetical protein
LGERLLVGGEFARIGNRDRNRLAALDRSGAVDESFDADVDGSVLALGIFANTLHVGGLFTRSGSAVRSRFMSLEL